MRKKTKQEYILELSMKNPNLELVGEYIDSNTKTQHKCKKHNIVWETTPHRALKGIGCEQCRLEKDYLARAKTHQEYVNEVFKISPHIVVLGQYVNTKTPILHKCLLHNIEWEAIPNNILKGCGCKECGYNSELNKAKTKTHEQYVQELALITSDIIVLGRYEGANVPILHKCLIDGHEWMAQPSNILSGKGCPKCSGNLKKTTDEYVTQVNSVNPNIEVIGEYVNSHTSILHKCKLHNIEWMTSPSSILQGSGCYKCSAEKLSVASKKTHEQYVKELNEVNANIITLEEYQGADIPILHKCLVDGNEWCISPAHTLSGGGCPQCHESKGERRIRNWLKNNDIDFIPQKSFDNCRDIKPLPFDFYLPNENILIEYDGKQHFKPIDFFGGQRYLEYIQKHDKIKNEYCKNNGISLLRIPYYDKNIEEELNNFLFI